MSDGKVIHSIPTMSKDGWDSVIKVVEYSTGYYVFNFLTCGGQKSKQTLGESKRKVRAIELAERVAETNYADGWKSSKTIFGGIRKRAEADAAKQFLKKYG